MTRLRPLPIALAWFSMALLWTACEKPYGEYDHRDLPSSIHISAKTEGNLHAHATVTFDATNPFPIICTGVFHQGLTYREERFADISEKGVDVRIKQKTKGFCNYKFSSISITCTDSSLQYEYDGKNVASKTSVIWPKEDLRGENSKYPIFEEPDLIIKNFSKENKEIYNCREDCEDIDWYSLTSSTDSIKVACEEGSQPND